MLVYLVSFIMIKLDINKLLLIRKKKSYVIMIKRKNKLNNKLKRVLEYLKKLKIIQI